MAWGHRGRFHFELVGLAMTDAVTPRTMVTDAEAAEIAKRPYTGNEKRLLADRDVLLVLLQQVWELRSTDALADTMWDAGQILKEVGRDA